MSQRPFDNTILRNFNSLHEIIYRASITDMSPEILTVSKFGLNQDIDANVEEDIWIAGGTKTVITSAADTEIVSSSLNDASAGTGARTVRVFGYDGNYDLISEDATLNGTTAVSLTNQFLDIYRIIVLTAGSGNTNDGTITVRHVTGPVTLGTIGAGYSITQQSHYIVPAGYTGYLEQFIVGISGIQGGGGTKVADISFNYMLDGGPWVKSYTGGFTSETGPVKYNLTEPFKLPEKTRLKLTCTPETNNTKAESIYTIVLINNEYL